MGGSAKKFPDLSGDGKVTQKDILMCRGVVEKSWRYDEEERLFQRWHSQKGKRGMLRLVEAGDYVVRLLTLEGRKKWIKK